MAPAERVGHAKMVLQQPSVAVQLFGQSREACTGTTVLSTSASLHLSRVLDRVWSEQFPACLVGICLSLQEQLAYRNVRVLAGIEITVVAGTEVINYMMKWSVVTCESYYNYFF